MLPSATEVNHHTFSPFDVQLFRYLRCESLDIDTEFGEGHAFGWSWGGVVFGEEFFWEFFDGE